MQKIVDKTWSEHIFILFDRIYLFTNKRTLYTLDVNMKATHLYINYFTYIHGLSVLS